MKYFISTLGLFLLFLVASCDSPGENFEHDNTINFNENLQVLADSYIERGIPGIILLTDSPSSGLTIIESGVANLETQESLSKDHLFHSASVMKIYTAVSVFMLEEQGLLNINDKISLHLDADLIAKIPNGEAATIRSILNHSSGIPDFAEQDDFLQDLIAYAEGTTPTAPRNFLEYIKDLEAGFPVGTRHSYSNSGSYILSLIVAEASGQSFEDFFHEKIIAALGLGNTFYRKKPSPPDYSRVPEYYIDWDSNGRLENSTMLENNVAKLGEGYNGLLATIEDYHFFFKALFIEKRIVSQASLDKMMAVSHSKDFGYGQGLEVILSDRFPDKFGHKGGTQSSFFYYPDEDLLMLSMLNYSFLNGESPYDRMAIVQDVVGVDGNMIGEIELCLFE